MAEVEPLAIEDFDMVASWLSRVEINQWLTSEWRNREVSSSTIAMVVRNKRNRIYLIREKRTPCGLVGLADIDPVDRVAMVWYLLGDDKFGGKGLVTEAVNKVMQLAFDEMHLENVYAWVMENNVPSSKVLERSGFKEAGRLRSGTRSNKKQVDRIYYDLIKDDKS